MKIAVPMQGNDPEAKISGHFGSAPYFAVIDEANGDISYLDRSGASCAPVDELVDAGVGRVIAVGMGQGAKNKLVNAGIDVQFVIKAPGVLKNFATALAEQAIVMSPDAEVCGGHHGAGHHEHRHHAGGNHSHHGNCQHDGHRHGGHSGSHECCGGH